MTAPLTTADLERIAAGDFRPLPGVDHPIYDLIDWTAAAHNALDGDDGDDSELRWMMAREAAHDDFQAWRNEHFASREDEDFDNWLANKASWNRPNKYEAALTVNQRAAMERACEAYRPVARQFSPEKAA